jgi:hypothetical protein
MRIGVIFAIYNCEEYVESCLSPWFKMKEKFDIITTVTSGRFNDYAHLGIPNKNKGTLKKLVNWNLDFMSITNGENLLTEDNSRNLCLNFLKPYECDLIWLVDGDEIYTVEQIESIIKYIESTPEIEGYSICLKNYTIIYPLFEPWYRPSIYRNRIYGGIGRFYFDSLFVYLDEIHGIKDIEVVKIPKNIAFIEHFTWLSNNSSTKDKILYQNERYLGNPGCRCVFEIDEIGLKYSEFFHKCRNIQIPILSEYPLECEILGNIFLNFNRNENKITLSSELEMMNVTIKVFDLEKNNIFNTFEFDSIVPGVIYWIIPVINYEFNNKGFTIQIFENNKETPSHTENLYLKTR